MSWPEDASHQQPKRRPLGALLVASVPGPRAAMAARSAGRDVEPGALHDVTVKDFCRDARSEAECRTDGGDGGSGAAA